MREDEPAELRESMRVLLAYLNGDDALDTALSAWRALRIEEREADDDDTGVDEDAFLGLERDTLPAAQQERLDAFLEALEDSPPGSF